MAHDAMAGSRFVCERKYPDDPKREVFEAAKSGDAVLLSEVLVQMNASEIASALASETREGEFRYFTPLKVALKHGNLACVKVLLKYKASIEIQGDENDDSNLGRNVNYTLLMACEYGGHVKIVSFLVEHGAEVDFQDKQGRTPLMYASTDGHMVVVRYLVEHGAKVDCQDKQGHTPLLSASSFGHMNVVRYLVAHGANMNLQPEGYYSPLMLASRRGDMNVVTYLVEHGANVDLDSEDGDTPLILASRNGYMNVVKFLIKHGANVNLVNKNGKTALSYICYSFGHVSFDVLSCLVKNGVDVNTCTIDNRTLLMTASRYGLENVVSYLVKHGANMDLQDKEGKTALMLANECNHMNVVTFLVQHGANMNLQDKKGNTLLMSASRNRSVNTVTFKGQIDAVRFLIKHGANLDLQDNNGDTALHHAVNGYNWNDVVHELLTLGASQLHNNQQLTPLLLASNKSKISMVEFLIKRPECTKKQKIDALELLGATLATDTLHSGRIDTEKAFEYITKGMTERFEDPSHPLLKQPMEPIEAYQNRKESQTLEELAQIKGDRGGIIMEGLIIRERILGTNNPELLDRIRDIAGCFNIPICIGLYRHAMKIAQHYNQSIIEDLNCLTCVLQKKDWRDVPPRQKDLVLELLVQTVLEYKKEQKAEQCGLFGSLLKLVQIIANFKHFEECQASHFSVLLQKLSHLNPQDDSGNTLLHFAVYHGDIHVRKFIYHGDTCRSVPRTQRNKCLCSKFPCIDTVKLLVNARFNVNAINNKGHTPLHITVTFIPSNDVEMHLLTDMLEVLLDGGAHHDFVDCDGKTAMDLAQTDEARMILSDKRKLELKCISARAVKKFGIAYLGMVPKTLEKYISMH